MTHASLFSGIGGPDLAAEWMGWENIFHCEINPFGQKVLNYYWPNSISYDNIITTDFSIHRGQIDVLTGGFPCQPYSLAGLRKGKEDERHLWPEMLRAIREVRPRWVVGENVLGLVGWNDGMVFEEVQADLEAEGYEVQPYVLPAASVGAPHRRDRVWFVAYCSGHGCERAHQLKSINNKGFREGMEEGYEFDALHGSGTPSDTKCNGDVHNSGRRGNLCNDNGDYQEEKSGRDNLANGTEGFDIGAASNSHCFRYPRGKEESTWKIPIDGDAWNQFPTQSPVCDGDDGLSSRLDRTAIFEATGSKSNKGSHWHRWRTESIKAGGNAIVPQVIHQIFKTIEAYEDL
jgi:DNA (cytosine-5)-methyltransferase 1